MNGDDETPGPVLIRGASALLTGLPGGAARRTGDVRIADGRIEAIGALEPRAGERTVDASGCVVTPGLVNTHHHLFQSVLKAIVPGADAALAEWLRLVPYRYGPHIDAEALEVAATIGLAELALSGTTTVADHHYIYRSDADFDADEVLFDAAKRFGVRFVLCRGGATRTRTFDGDRTTPMPTETLDAMFGRIEATAARHHDPSPNAMTRVAVAPATPTFSVETGELAEIAAFARGRGLRLHTHLSENLDYERWTLERFGKRPVHWLAEHGWLGPDVWFAHLVHCDAGELDRLVESGAGMAHCPQANARLGSGIAPSDAFARRGGRVSLAVDGAAANEAADMVQAMHAALTLHRAAKGVEALDVDTALCWATAGGADVLGFDGLGTLEPGKPADVAVFALDAPRHLGRHDPASALVLAGGAPTVRASFVAGRQIVVDGAVPGLDLDELGHRAATVVDRLRRRVAAEHP